MSYHCRTYGHGPLHRPSNMAPRLERTGRGRSRGNRVDPHLTYRAYTYFHRVCSTIVTEVKLAHLDILSLTNENPWRQVTSQHCLLPRTCSPQNCIVPTFDFPNNSRKPQTLQLIQVVPRLSFALVFQRGHPLPSIVSAAFHPFYGPG